MAICGWKGILKSEILCPIQDDCLQLKSLLEQIALNSRLTTKSTPDSLGNFLLLNRTAIEELESWYFGDAKAIKRAYPNIKSNIEKQAKYREPDKIINTWETLERLLNRYGYYKSGLPKTDVARTISTFMTPDENRSRSFQVFRDGLLSVVNI